MTTPDVALQGSVVHLSFSGDFGGRERVASSLNRIMGSLGRACKLYMVVELRAGEDRNANLLHLLEKVGGKCRIFRTNARVSYGLMRKLAVALRGDKAAVVHCHCYKSLSYAVLMRLTGMIDAVIVHTLHGLVIPHDFNSNLIRAVEKVGFLLADGIIGCSREVLETTLRPGWRRPTRVIVNAVESAYPSFKELSLAKLESRDRLARRYEINSQNPIVINVGRLCPQKDFHLYLQLVKLLAEKAGVHHLTNFFIVGDGELRSILQEEADRLKVADRVKFTGFVKDIGEIYLAADLLVQSSFWEGTPMCLLEARSFGLPVVAPAVGGNAEVVRQGWDGALYPVGDLAELAEQTMRYLVSPDLRQEHGSRAFEHVKTEFSVQEWAERHFDFYHELLSARRRRAKARA